LRGERRALQRSREAEYQALSRRFLLSFESAGVRRFDIAKCDIKTKARRGGRAKRPRVFTEHGALMAASILNSDLAVSMSVYVIRAFIQMREQPAANTAILKRLAEIDKSLLLHDSALVLHGFLWEKNRFF